MLLDCWSLTLVLICFIPLQQYDITSEFKNVHTPIDMATINNENPCNCHVIPTDTDTSVTSLPSFTQHQNLFSHFRLQPWTHS